MNQPIVMQNGPSNLNPNIRNIALDLILTLVTCGLFNIFVQYKQILALNQMLKQEKYNFAMWLILTIITCGLYHIYHEYRMSADLALLVKDSTPNLPLISLILAIFGLSIITDAIQQAEINKHYGSSAL